ncbi:hypothetical protein [Bradymonas sediminis]|uniref:Uncharacterized protein n=1 Tax=Bradymonas sediminis TaxID=1548548 RepID=A0A2Z4FGT3_9DELT|nr:hypothetical protein [Bradymonas sediminis]AWV87964.1 hypothetical protein DN745_00910 [Bradymonas sediminis]TDP62983.1 hypothetical protein DFR33_111116 [Bradymonas sediminis]
MLNKTVLYGLALLLAALALLLSGGMGSHHWLRSIGEPQRATLQVLGGAPFYGVGVKRGAAMRFELFECASRGPIQSVTIPLWADSIRRFRAYSDFKLRPEAAHRFGDITWQVTPGCHRVRAQVVDQAGVALGSCEPADTPNSFLESGESQSYVILSECEAPDDHAGVRLQEILNRAPRLDPIEVTPLSSDASCSSTKVCATAHDPDGDPLKLEWTLRSHSDRLLPTPTPTVGRQRLDGESSRTECILLPANTQAAHVDVQVRDLSGALPAAQVPGQATPARAEPLLSFEDLYLGDFGLVARSRDHESAKIPRTCNPTSCPANPADRIRMIRYWIGRDGVLLPPTSDLSQAAEGDTIDVEFDVAPGCHGVRVQFSSMRLHSADAHTPDSRPDTAPTSTVSSAANIFEPGTHILWNRLPNCHFRVELRAAETHTGEASAPGARSHPEPALLDAYHGGEHPCPTN